MVLSSFFFRSYADRTHPIFRSGCRLEWRRSVFYFPFLDRLHKSCFLTISYRCLYSYEHTALGTEKTKSISSRILIICGLRPDRPLFGLDKLHISQDQVVIYNRIVIHFFSVLLISCAFFCLRQYAFGFLISFPDTIHVKLGI